jgi:hypothetical protein
MRPNALGCDLAAEQKGIANFFHPAQRVIFNFAHL